MQERELAFSKEWKAFLRQKRHLFIYGAGYYGRMCMELLEQSGGVVEGFLVSSENHPDFYFGVPVLTASSFSVQEGDGIIVAFARASYDQLNIPRSRETDCLFPSSEWLMNRYLRDVWFPQLEKMDRGEVSKAPLHEKPRLENILVVRLDMIGDFLLTTPFLRELRRNYPAAHISLVVYDDLLDLACGCPFVDEVVSYPPEKLSGGRKKKVSWETEVAWTQLAFRELQDRQWDAVFLPRQLTACDHSCRGLLFAVLSGAPLRFGRMDVADEPIDRFFCREAQTMLSPIFQETEPKHETQYILDLLRACYCDVLDVSMEYWISEANRVFAREALGKRAGWAYIACGIVGSQPYRSWAPENYRKLFEKFNQENVMFVLLGGRDASEAAAAIGVHANIIDMTSRTTLPQAAAIIEASDLYVGSDTGLLHFASATGTPIVEFSVWLHGGDLKDISAPHRIGPWHVPTRILIPEPGLEGCQGRCRKSYAHCINTITPEAAEKAMRDLLCQISEDGCSLE